ncbi:HlyD family efflux transporter periplasmic adaptor subunit [Permianibacter sp. IMCC34836]|uniref:efflux RND transporter periplasmic adaptor subunit n=1 Tax=Permianibacter fluminis TaxID=2738515 RepID=UPI001552923C|nr:HlyD family efflux transporter periplasmic adaptor subunit [Permianibacter fluminis]NQD38446.1 HlyD family efflux transporter periplasmic adaptor subunit [Permianibacter fluminis]
MDRLRPASTPRWHKRHALWLLAGLTVTAALAYSQMALNPAGYRVARAAVTLGTVSEGAFDVRVHGTGLLLPVTVRWVAAQVEGRVEQVNAKAGSAVAAGDVLVELSNPALQQAEEEIRWSLEAMQAEYSALKVALASEQLNQQTTVVKAEFAYNSAKLQLDAEARLIADKGQVISALDHKRTQLNVQQLAETLRIEQDRLHHFDNNVRAQLSAKDAQVEKLRKQYLRSKEQVAALTVRAPIAGIVQALPLEPGQRLIIGGNIAKLADPAALYAELKIPEQQARDLALNQLASIDTRIGVVTGTVTRIDPAVANGMVKVDVTLTDALPKGARPDLSVDGTVQIAALANARFVPRPALSQANQQTRVYRLTDGDHAERIPVQFGQASVNVIEIKTGLQPGDRIVLNDTTLWGDPERIELN